MNNKIHTTSSVRYILILLIIFRSSSSFAQSGPPPWTFVRGDSLAYLHAYFGTQNVASASNRAGGMSGAVTWTYNGKSYVFGGNGYTDTAYIGFLGDLWEYDHSTGYWKWLKGPRKHSQAGVYGTKGTAAPGNMPGGRYLSYGWTLNGKLYLMGGVGYDANGSQGYLNDLWQYDLTTGNWTWLKGSNVKSATGTYGSVNVVNAANTPGAKANAATWVYNNKLFLFGGSGFASNTTQGQMNDLWSYDPATNNWTWHKGNSTVNQDGEYGTINVAASSNKPGSRSAPGTWVYNNKLYMFGGDGYAASGTGRLNDLWSYDPGTNNWTYLKGNTSASNTGTYPALGTATSSSKPGARYNATTWLLNNQLYLLGGSGYNAGGQGLLNDLWRYDPSTGNWTWLKGDNDIYEAPVTGLKNVGASGNSPGAKSGGSAWTSGGKLYLWGGLTSLGSSSVFSSNDLWEFDPSTNFWTWKYGDNNDKSLGGSYGTKNVPVDWAHPGARSNAASWSVNGLVYLFGGYGASSANQMGTLNDVWAFDPATSLWTWIGGDTVINPSSVYGTKNLAASTNKPGGRYGAARWVLNGIYYSFGGYGIGASTQNFQNDMWSFNPATGNWTWIGGSSSGPLAAAYGTQGVSSTANIPGPRVGSCFWELNSKFYLFGGTGYANGASTGMLNDLWEYDPSTGGWKWLKGDNTINATGSYGTKGVSAGSNVPRSRYGSGAWARNNKLYLYGGFSGDNDNNGSSDYLGDLWEYDLTTNNWTWISGVNTADQPAVFGTKGVASAGNFPGGMGQMSAWTKGTKCYLFGGQPYDYYGGALTNALWEYDPAANTWAWISGDEQENTLAICGTAGVPSTDNKPGARAYATACAVGNDIYVFGGMGYKVNGENSQRLDDLMYTTITGCDPVVPSISIAASANPVCAGTPVTFTASVSNEGTAPSYQWQSFDGSNWGNIAGANSITYSSSSLANNAKIRCILTSNADCATTPTAASNEITMTISQPAATGGLTSNVSCHGGSNGSASVNVSGGISPYAYSWNNPVASTTAAVSGLAAGNYTVTFTDNIGCIATSTITISEPTAVTVSPSGQTNISCFGSNDGVASVSVTGGAPAGIYSYVWSSSASTSNTATGLTPGSHTVTVKDINNCTGSYTFNITEPSALDPVVSPVDVSCFNAADGSASVSVSGGTGTYSYSWSSGGSTANNIAGLTPGSHSVTVTDGAGCTATETFSITQPGQLIVNASGTDISCFGGNTGSAATAPAGGTAPYSYDWAPGGAATQNISGLAAGSYSVTVTDAHGCIATGSVTLTEPAALIPGISSGDASCFGHSDGSAAVTLSGGVAPYTYDWDYNSETGSSITGIPAGVYHCTVTDANGCTSVATATVAQPAALPAPSISVTPTVVCSGYDAVFTATAANAGASPVYQWTDNGVPVGTNSDTYSATALQPSHIIRCEVTSSEACSPVSTGLSNSVTVPSVPVTQANTPIFTSVTANQVKLRFTRGSGNGGAVILVSYDAPGDTDPLCGTSYTGSATTNIDYNDPALVSLGNAKLIYRVTGSSPGTLVNVTLNNLSAGRYYFRVYEYNTTANGPAYLKPALEADTSVLLVLPSLNVTNVNVSAIFSDHATITWDAGNGTGRLVVVTPDIADLPTPATNVFYTANSTWGLGDLISGQSYVVYNGTGTSVTVDGLSPQVKYNAFVYEYTDDGIHIRYKPRVKRTFRTTADYYKIAVNGREVFQDFDSLATDPDGDITPGKWLFTEVGTGADFYYQPSDGNVPATGIYSFGTGTDRAFGSYSGSGLTPHYGLRIKNGTNDTITSLLVSYTGEQWYRGNTGSTPDQLRFFYSTTVNQLSATSGFTRVPALDFISPVTTGSGPLDGNDPANQRKLSASITGISVLPGDYLWIRFTDQNIGGGNDAMAIDDLSFVSFSNTIVGGGDIIDKNLNDLNIVGGTAVSQVNCLSISYALNMEQGGKLDIAPVTGKRGLNIKNKIFGNGTISTNENSSISIAGQDLGQTLYLTPGMNTLKGLCVKAGASAHLGSEVFVSGTAKGQVTIGGNTGSGTLYTHGLLTLGSDSTGTAMIGKVNGTIAGDVKVERYFYYKDALRLLAHPFSSTITAAQIDDDISLSFTPGSENCWWYDPSTSMPGGITGLASATSWNPVTGTGFSWDAGQALRLAKTAGTALVDMNGPVNQGNINLPLSFGADSFFVVGNPYPATLKPGAAIANAAGLGLINDAAIYTWDPTKGTEGAFVTIPNSDLADCKIPGNSAFVVLGTPGTTASLDFMETDKAPYMNVKTFFRDGEEVEEEVEAEDEIVDIEHPEGFKLTLSKNDRYYDASYIRFDEGAKDSRERLDAPKICNPGVDLYSRTPEGDRLSLDVRPFEAGSIVPLVLDKALPGNYKLSVSDWNLPARKSVYLVDTYTGREKLLAEQGSYAFDVDAENASQGGARFYLRMGEAIAQAPALTLDLLPNPARERVTIRYKALPEEKGTVRIYSATGQLMTTNSFETRSGEISISLDRFVSGVYLVELSQGSEKISRQLLKQ